MAGLQIDPTSIETARAAGYSDAEIVNHLSAKAPDQFKAAKDAGYDDGEILAHFSGKAPEPSGALAGAVHGMKQLAHGVAETARQNGVGSGYAVNDPNYVPANPLHPSEWGQVLTENLPAFGGALTAGTLAKGAAGLAKVPNRYAKLAGLGGAALAGWLMTAGDTAKHRAEVRTGNPDAEPTAEDKTIGYGTAAAAQAAGSIGPGRFIPGMVKAGLPTATSALQRAAGSVAAGAAGNAAASTITQAGTTAGTDQGLTVDPLQVGKDAVTGAVTSGLPASFQLAGGMARASSMREHTASPENIAATKAVATRLENAAGGADNLGASWKGATKDHSFNEVVKSDIKNELGDAAKNVRQQVPQLSPDADNALQRAQNHEPLTANDVALIAKETAGAPDGPNAAFLARQVHMQQLMNDRGSYTKGKWAGGVSGAFDANVGYMLNPFRAATGIGASAMGMHLLGASNPLFMGSALGAYGIARSIDSLTGMRSPAKTFAEHFADRNAQLRVPTQQTPAPPAPPPPSGQAQGPWGPKPLPQQSVPQQAAPQAPQAAPASFDPLIAQTMAHAALMQKAQPPAPEPQAPQLDPLNLPTSITKSAKNLMGGIKTVQEIREKEQARTAVAGLQSPLVEEAPLDVTQNPMVGKRASQLVSAANALRKYTGADVAEREQAQAEAQAAREEKAAAKAAEREKTATERAQAMADRAKIKAEAAAVKAQQVAQREAHKAELAKAKIEAKAATDKVKAAAAKVKAPKPEPKAAPEAPKEAPQAEATYEPISDDLLTRRGLSDDQVSAREVADYAPGLRDKYAKNIKFRRSTLRNRLEEVAGDANDVDSSAIGKLYHQIDHSHSQKDVQRHLAHWTAKMDPATKQAIHAAVAPLLKLWKE
jgi:hypothetical protein